MQNLLFVMTMHCVVGTCIRIASWNILAPTYASPSKFLGSLPSRLLWEHRFPLIVKKLKEYNPDAIFLQEVQSDVSNALDSELGEYEFVIQNTTKGHPSHCVIAVRKDRMQVKYIESRSRALFAEVHIHGDECTQPLYLASCHLQAGIQEDDTRFHQLSKLLKRIHQHSDEEEKIRLVMAGDFNMLRNNPLHGLLCTGETPGSLIQQTLPLLPLADVYYDSKLRKTYCKGTILDYIWVTQDAMKVGELWYSFEEATQGGYHSWPDDVHPSDHIPIGVDLNML